MPRIDGGRQRRVSLRWSPFRSAFTPESRTVSWHARSTPGQALHDHVLEHARPGDLGEAIRVVEEYGTHDPSGTMVDVGRGDVLEDAVRRAEPELVLQLGVSCGYAALRAARALPDRGHVLALEPQGEHAWVARSIWRHAGIAERATVILGSMGDGWTAQALSLRPGAVDVLFVGHPDYLGDVARVAHRAWMHDGSVVITHADGVPTADSARA